MKLKGRINIFVIPGRRSTGDQGGIAKAKGASPTLAKRPSSMHGAAILVCVFWQFTTAILYIFLISMISFLLLVLLVLSFFMSPCSVVGLPAQQLG